MTGEGQGVVKAVKKGKTGGYFQMPLHYPRYTRDDYQHMPETLLDRLLAEYGLSVNGDLDFKRSFAIGTFLWPAKQQQRSSSSSC